jgi:hypothetical protein
MPTRGREAEFATFNWPVVVCVLERHQPRELNRRALDTIETRLRICR